MRASAVKLSDLKTWESLYDARNAIENDPANIIGGIKAWASGYETRLTSVARKKVDAIERKMEKVENE